MISNMSTRKPRGPKPKKVSLSPKQEEILDRLIKRPGTPQQTAQRARIVKQSACGARNQHIADTESVMINTVKKWRNRWREAAAWLAGIEAGGTAKELGAAVAHILADQPRSGTPARFTAEQICRIVALACEPPKDYERPVTHWTPQELAAEAVKQKIVESISARQVGRFLKGSRFETASVALLAAE